MELALDEVRRALLRLVGDRRDLAFAELAGRFDAVKDADVDEWFDA